MRTKILGTALTALVLTASAYADAIFTPGNNPQPNEENVLLNGSGVVNGNPIDGHTNMTHTAVQFSSATCSPGQTCLSGTGGQSDIDAGPGFGPLVHNITITIPANSPGCASALGCSFQDLVFNPFKEATDHDVNLTAVTNEGTFTLDNFGMAHGQNFVTITVTPGDAIHSVTIDSPDGFQDLKQIRMSGPFAAIVPEPSSMLLLGSGVLVFTQVLRRKRL